MPGQADEPGRMPGEHDPVPCEPARAPRGRVGKTAARLARVRRGRVGGIAARILRPPSTGRGFLLALLVVGGVGSAVAAGGSAFQKFSETEGFCSRCHTMAPEAAAHKLGVHRDVACGECHVAPGIAGVVKSKLRGATQLFELITDTYPKPIPPPDPDLLPPRRHVHKMPPPERDRR